MQTTGRRPAARQALTFLLIMSLVSPMTWRRSLCPVRQNFTPRSLSISTEISPVNAPFFSW